MSVTIISKEAQEIMDACTTKEEFNVVFRVINKIRGGVLIYEDFANSFDKTYQEWLEMGLEINKSAERDAEIRRLEQQEENFTEQIDKLNNRIDVLESSK
jgi:peptidoglycan hydrolase CwlO-like protein